MRLQSLDAVRKSVFVTAAPEKAWEVFVDRMATWWPLATHSIGGEDAVAAIVDGTRIYERTKDGTEHTWARITVFEPPTRLAFTWVVHPGEETEVEVTFTAEEGGTRVELVHAGWAAEPRRQSYDDGWSAVLARFEDAVGG